jgi:hypothetical protein
VPPLVCTPEWHCWDVCIRCSCISPFALVLIAAVAELGAMATRMRKWRTVAAANVRAGAAFLRP